MADRPSVMISSTSLDLPEHRKEVLDACARQEMFPLMMEHLPASDADAIAASQKLVDEAEIYLGIFAHRYGYVPTGQEISITEMEYNRAIERGIPRLIFIIDKDHQIKIEDVERENVTKLDAFKVRLQAENVVNFFKSPPDLRGHVINSLSKYRKRDQTAFQFISDISAPPEKYVAHPYTLLHARGLIGRHEELDLLTDWVADPNSEPYQARVFNVVAIGGMGKSALTWKWFNGIAPQEMKPLAGRMWWSFYESDATFDNFVIRALAYVTNRAREDIEKNLKLGEREEQLLSILNREPFLIVLDGLERILLAYARMDANRLADSEINDHYQQRKTTDPHAGSFLRKLTQVKASRVLISTRLFPADLQDRHTGDITPGAYEFKLQGLSVSDALELWRSFEVTGSRDVLVPLFRSFDNHALMIKVLAGEVKRSRRAGGDFEKWQYAHKDFNPYRLISVQDAISHVLSFALHGLDEKKLKTLQVIAAFRMPASYDTLIAVMIGYDKLFSSEIELDAALTDLEDRGLLGWDKRANRYDLHPIVRGVVWSVLTNDMRRDVYTTLHTHFEALPMIEDYHQVESLQDLTPAIELYNILIGLGLYDDAIRLFYERMQNATLYRLSASRQQTELVEMLFPDGLDQLPCLSSPLYQAYTLATLALGYDLSGQPGRSLSLHRRQNAIQQSQGNDKNLGAGLENLSSALMQTGALSESQLAVLQSLVINRKIDDLWGEAESLEILGLILAARGRMHEADRFFQRALRIFLVRKWSQGEGVLNASMAQLALWNTDHAAAFLLANHAWELANDQRHEKDFIRAARLQGEALLRLNDLERADERLHHALTRARAVNHVEEELPALIALAELRRRQGNSEAARELLDDIWESAERGPYPLFHADALNVLAQIERDASNTSAAIEAATNAYRNAWCDGPPFAYHWGLEAARAHLKALGAPEPTDLPAYDESKHEPMPDVEIDPPDLPVELESAEEATEEDSTEE